MTKCKPYSLGLICFLLSNGLIPLHDLNYNMIGIIARAILRATLFWSHYQLFESELVRESALLIRKTPHSHNF